MRWFSVRKQRRVLILFLLLSAPFASILNGVLPFVPRVEEVAAQPWAPQPMTWMNISGSSWTQAWIFREQYPPASFTIDIVVDNVTDLFAWEFKLGWNASILNFTSVAEGPFLSGAGATVFYNQTFEDETGLDYILVNCTLTGGSSVSGSGLIANATFTVQSSGETQLDLYETSMKDSGQASIKHSVTDGYVLTGDFSSYVLLYAVPQTNIANTGEFFNVTVWIDEVSSLYSWQFALEWDPFWLITAVDVTDHNFLQGGGSTFNIGDGIVSVGATLTGVVEGISGSGRLTTVTFQVSPYGYLGETFLNFTAIKLSALEIFDPGPPLDYEKYDIEEFTAFGSYFRTSKPFADFTFTPERPAVNKTDVIFNATNSRDPVSGSIVNYHWDFNDSSTPIDTVNPIETHTFSQVGEYSVNLTVTDDEGENASTVNVVTVVIRDVAVTEILASHKVAMTGTLVNITVSVENNGTGYQPSDSETFDVNVYAINQTGGNVTLGTQENVTLTEGESANLNFEWNTTGFNLGVYTIQTVVPTLQDENYENNNDANTTITLASFNLVPYSVQIGGLTFQIFVESTHEPTDFYFNTTALELGFNITGPPGSFSYSNVTIPKALLKSEPLTDWTILFDGQPILAPIITENATHTFLYFNYTLSTHKIQIKGTSGPGLPVAAFTFSPIKQFVFTGEIITFNASASYDPDGYIAEYFWDFDDGTTNTTTNPIITHAFQEPAIGSPFNITLRVTDDNPGFSDTSSAELNVFWPFDIEVSDITTSATTANLGEILTINVTITNKVDHKNVLLFNLTILGNNSVLAEMENVIASTGLGTPSGTSVSVEFDWNTSNVALGIYTLKAEVKVTQYDILADEAEFPPELNTDDNTFVYGDILVKKWDSTLEIDVSPTTTTVDSPVIINGTLSPMLSGVEVTIQSKLGENDWSNITTVLTRLMGQFIHVWTPTEAGTYQIKASWAGDTVTSASVSSIKTVTVDKLSSVITLEVDLSSITIGSQVTLSGKIEPSRSNVQVTLYVRKGVEWNPITTTTTDDQSNYSFEWEPTETGTLEIQAKWDGDANTLASESDVKQVQVEAAAEPIPMNLVIYAVVGVAIIVIAGAGVYFLKFKRTK